MSVKNNVKSKKSRNEYYNPTDVTEISKQFNVGDHVIYRGNTKVKPFYGTIKNKYMHSAIVTMEDYNENAELQAIELNHLYTCSYDCLKVIKDD
ncbi:hypothetical protein N6G95_09660 [Pediococcus inopinatus]|uniref:hypothetical protein n=1 Tax=Pediococcus inopinatus TaxID=114090 RepID=UPI002B25C88B|nr:hypothetical protein [Pediococcus inopinatus]WPC19469.1 hypothetical protein N6G95_09660 [Pediococcus inopinatus]